MNRTYIKDLNQLIGTTVKLNGFAENQREMGKLTFVDLRDVTGKVQCVAFNLAGENMRDVTLESVLEVIGEVKARPEKMVNKDQPNGSVEIEVKEYKLINKSEGLPIQINSKASNEAETDVRLDYRWLDLRKPEKLLTFKVWTELERAMIEYWTNNNYMNIHSPKILGAPSESGAEVFEVKYFDRTAYLAQSPQFYKQMAMAAGFEKVFEIGSVFRAENSNTIRHTTEFTGYDAEISYIDSHFDVMAEEEKLLTFAMQKVVEKYADEVKSVFGIELIVPTMPFPKMTMIEAKAILAKLGIKSEKDGDLSGEEERELGKYVETEMHHEFVFVTDYPIEVRPFYHMRHEDNPKLTKSFDLLYKGIEITTGAQREHRYEKLVEQAKEKGMNLANIQFYLDFFKYGMPNHGGFGMGPSRLLMKILGLESIRESMFIFRNPRRLNP
jgi:nondiscriminating aspartyl-tRNA synthetase